MNHKSLRTNVSAIAAVVTLSVFSGLSSATTHSNNHNDDIFYFGVPDTTSYGQVFNASGTLKDWSFYASSGSAGNLQLVIADWNGSYAVNSQYTSSVFNYSGGSEVLQFKNINLDLASGDHIAFITVAGIGSAASNVSMAGSNGGGGLGGGFTFANTNGIDPISLGSGAGWITVGDWSPSNMQFTATITAVPEPFTYAMLLAGLGLLGFMTRKKQSI